MSYEDKRTAWRAVADAARLSEKDAAVGEYTAYQSAEMADIYDAVYANADDLAFWLEVAEDAGPGPLLELASGTGRLMLPLARAGYEVTGVDTSPHMLARCRQRLANEPPEVQERVVVFEADMTSFALSREFALIFCAFGSFHHLSTVDQQLQCLQRCREHLRPGGTLVLDLINPDPVIESESDGVTSHPDISSGLAQTTDGRCIRSWATVLRCRRSLQVNDCEITYEITETNGIVRQHTETFPMRFLFRFELEHLLARSGFRIAALYGDYDRSAFADGSLGMIALAHANDD
jgi:SAM-dependent methyltransferase